MQSEVKAEFDEKRLIGKFTPKALDKAVRESVKEGVKIARALVKEAFEQEAVPGGGQKWKPLSNKYKAQKQKLTGGKHTLEFKGDLKDAAVNAEPEYRRPDGGDEGEFEAEVKVREKKATTHQFGRGKIPARPFYSFARDGVEEINDAMTTVFEEELKK